MTALLLPAETAITSQGAVPVLRAGSADAAYEMCAKLIGAGLSVIELTATTPGWAELLPSVNADFPDAVIGMGTITTAYAATVACEAGASFLVSPYPADEARAEAVKRGVLFVGGGATPAEIAASSAHGVCKLFPAHLGGVQYLKTLKAILPAAKIMPTGGIALTDVSTWIAAGAVAVGVGSELVKAPDLAEAAAALRQQVAAGRA
ncbi:MAG TPA: bifunctional 4-hydroxy-2-oxoglutarate aldolase/2-dehydro-3-deoxy-phosphogluconate aldolase [Candidatus Lumbricidophila sp.]|nr:bifunctional 4-hydroxy-2-oxoglutarate aldolase/2-dehydro-3-deoxy-phosphogluconate aldolase [Candidatus Lumbricidophila sp.]